MMLPFGRVQPRLLTVVILTLIFALTGGVSLAAEGKILPPTARVAGHSLRDAAQETAYFNTSLDQYGYRDESRYPREIPFQVLYLKPDSTFKAHSGTTFYVPLWYVDDSPDVIGVFPSDHAGALHYAFDRSQLGVRNVTLSIDGQIISIPNTYLAGPISSRLGDGSGTHYITQGVFLKLQKGTHTLVYNAVFDGKLITDLTGGEPLTGYFSYTVVVK